MLQYDKGVTDNKMLTVFEYAWKFHYVCFCFGDKILSSQCQTWMFAAISNHFIKTYIFRWNNNNIIHYNQCKAKFDLTY
jgi:hypothetical protein